MAISRNDDNPVEWLADDPYNGRHGRWHSSHQTTADPADDAYVSLSREEDERTICTPAPALCGPLPRMIELDVPGEGKIRLEHLVLDYNGTLAIDGRLIDGVAERLEGLSARLSLHVVTADTFGKARTFLSGLPCRVVVLEGARQSEAKRDYVERLGPRSTACVGNGRNDLLMMQTAQLGIAVIQTEGASGITLAAARLVCTDIRDALDLLLQPLRLAATLRE